MLIGDVYVSWVLNLYVDFEKISLKIFGVEFVGILIIFGGNGVDKWVDIDKILKENLYIKFFNDYCGYVCCIVMFY